MIARPQEAIEARAEERLTFLSGSDWRHADVIALGSDASIRQYFRLEGGPKPALLMDAPSAAQTPPCPPEADDAERRRLGYGALVRGSGSSLIAYDAASQLLAERGVLVPRVLAADISSGFAIIDDLGAELVSDAAKRADEERGLYLAAADILDHLREKPSAPGEVHGWSFQAYDQLAYEVEADLLAEWYLPKMHGHELSDQDRERLVCAWRQVFAQLSPPQHLVHRDFHADNLIIAVGQIGVLDFQDMMIGQAAYDWASLIEDARRDVDAGLRNELYARGRDGADDPQAFETDYSILAAQRNAKILGLFARLAYRDGKKRYIDLMPRVRTFFAEDLARPALAPVASVMRELCPEVVA